MNFFEQELRKLFDGSGIVDGPTYSGRCCFGTLGKDLRMRAQFITTHGPKEYNALKLEVLNRTGGPVDMLILRFKDLLGLKMVPNHHYMCDGMEPHIWEDYKTVEWFSYRPTAADYETIRQAAKQYLDMFRDRQQERDQGGPSLDIRLSAGQKPLGRVRLHRQAARKGRDAR